MPKETINLALTNWDGPLGLPRFGAIKDEDYAPAFDAAMAEHDREIDEIANSVDAPTFENVITRLELAGKSLSRVGALFWNRAGADTNKAIQALEREIAPKLSRHYSKIAQNRELFARVDAVWQGREAAKLTREQSRVLERHWKGFVRSGARLTKDKQKELAGINERLALLGAEFGQNILADEAEWHLHVEDEADLAGLPDFLKDAMEEAAKAHGHETGYAVTLSRSIIEPFLTFSERRDLRETAWRAWIGRGEGEHDNRPLVTEILRLRGKKAVMLGYRDYAAYKLDDTMAKTPEAVNGLLMPVWEKAVERAGEEAGELSGLIAEAGLNHKLEAWDWRFYAEKLRERKFSFSEGELKPYLQLDRIIEAAFDTAGRLFDLTFKRREDIAGYHPDVRVFEVHNASGKLSGVFMGDYFARASKRSGAWMSGFQSAHKLPTESGVGQMPFIYNVMNFARAAKGQPCLLSLDDARTLFHEFGHALHGLLSQATYPSVSGTSVARDFVELPSQLYEHWLTTPEILKKYAVHYKTGEPMPQALADKVEAARNFNAGFNTVEYTASALVDMAFHTAGEVADPMAFEAEKLAELDMPEAMVMRHRTPHFAHVFSGDGYSAGYYSYMWSEVLDADAFSAFEETKDHFDPVMAEKLLANIYSTGGSIDPEDAYKAFRGKLPSPEAMMEKRGLV